MFLAKVLRLVHKGPGSTPAHVQQKESALQEDSGDSDQDRKLTLKGLVGRMSRLATYEASQTPKQTHKVNGQQ